MTQPEQTEPVGPPLDDDAIYIERMRDQRRRAEEAQRVVARWATSPDEAAAIVKDVGHPLRDGITPDDAAQEIAELRRGWGLNRRLLGREELTDDVKLAQAIERRAVELSGALAAGGTATSTRGNVRNLRKAIQRSLNWSPSGNFDPSARLFRATFERTWAARHAALVFSEDPLPILADITAHDADLATHLAAIVDVAKQAVELTVRAKAERDQIEASAAEVFIAAQLAPAFRWLFGRRAGISHVKAANGSLVDSGKVKGGPTFRFAAAILGRAGPSGALIEAALQTYAPHRKAFDEAFAQHRSAPRPPCLGELPEN